MLLKNLIATGLIAASVTFAVPAKAGTPQKDPLLGTPTAAAFSGLYVGLHVGRGWSYTSIRDNGTLGPLSAPPYGAFACGTALTGNYCGVPFELDATGWLGGGQIGFNWRANSILYGVEGELGFSKIAKEFTLIRPFQDRDIASIDMKWYATLTGRLGFVVPGDVLFYVKAGAAFAHFNYFAADLDLVSVTPRIFQIYPGSVVMPGGTQTGWTLGGGAEYALNERISLKAEYLYMDFGAKTAISPDGDRYKFETKVQTFKLGINYHFPIH